MAIRSANEPFGWWGPVWAEPVPRSIGELVSQGVLSEEAAALLKALIGRRASVVVAAGPSGAGKTTLLTALLEFSPEGTRRIYVRGCYEPFDFLTEAEPGATALLVNEISPHLPIYLWGPGVRRLLGAARDGFQVLATAHAESVEEFVYSLASSPLRVPAAEIAALDLLVLLDAWLEGDGVRREVREIAWLTEGRAAEGIAPIVLAARDGRGEPLVLHAAGVEAVLAAHCPSG